MKKTLGVILSLFLLIGLLAGCTQAPANNGAAPAPEAAAPADGGEVEPEAEEEASAWPRTYVDALEREVVLEKKPEKPALIFFRNFEHIFALKQPLTAAADVADVLNGWLSLRPYAEQMDVIDLGDMWTPNLEKLLEVDPDLIIVFSGIYEQIGEQLDKISTVVTVNNYGDDWQTPISEYGKIFGEEEAAEKEIARLQGLIESARETLTAYEDKTFAFLALRGEKELVIYALEFVYSAERGLGLKGPGNYTERGRETISLEGLAELNPDYLFLYDDALTTKDEDIIEEFEKSAVWNALTAVKEDQVFLIDRSTFAGGPLAIEYGVGEILKALGE